MSESYEVDLGLAAEEVKRLLNASLPIAHLRQPGAAVCWATCIAMVDRWQEKAKSFCTYVKRQSPDCGGCDSECPEILCDKPREPADFLGDWHHFGYKDTFETPAMLIFPAIREYLKEEKPVQAYFVHKDRKSAHVVLITGALKNDACDDMLVIVDPLKKEPMLIYSMQVANWGSWERTWVISW